MKKFYLLFILLFLPTFLLFSQTPTVQDCLGAIPLCNSSYHTTNSYTGTGNYSGEIPTGVGCPGGCLLVGEKNDVWYTFTVSAGGMLAFTITPNHASDDYDWAVYNLTNATCADIATNTNLQVSCNYTANPGATGASTANGGTSNCTSATGGNWNKDIPVTAGQIYVINVSNYSSTQYGYTIDFSQTTANIIDNIPPTLQSVLQPIPCGSTSVNLTFSENVLCNTVNASDFVFTGPGGPYTITNVVGVGTGCSGAQHNNRNFILTVSPAISASGTYSVGTSSNSSITDDCGNVCPGSTFNFTIIGVSSTVNSFTNPTCSTGNDGTITAFASGGTAPYVYSLNGGTTTQASGTFSGLAPGTYIVTSIDHLGCKGISSPITLNAVAPVNPGLISTSQFVCNGSSPDTIRSASPATTGAAGGINYTWESTNVPGCASGWTTIPGATLSYYVPTAGMNSSKCYRRVAADNCSLAYSDTVTINTTGPHANAGPDTSVCSGLSIVLNASGGSFYSWSPAATLNNPNIATPTATPLVSTNYVVTVTDNNNCSATDNIIVTIRPTPVATTSPDTSVCLGNSIMIKAFGGATYNWNPDPTLTPSNVFDPIVTPTANTTYLVTVSSNFGCTNSADVTVNVNTLPAPVITPSGQTGFCDTASVNVSLDAGAGYASYLWSTGATTQVINVTQPGNYSVTVVDPKGCTGTSASAANIYVSPPLSIPIILALTTPTFCQNDSVMLYLANAYYSYQWSSGSMTPDIYSFETDNYTVTVTDSLGCRAVSNPFHVQVNPLPDAYASYSNNLLNVSFFDFSFNSTSWNWKFGDGNSSTLENPNHLYSAAGIYTVIFTATNNCGSDYDTLVLDLPGPAGINNYENDLENLLIYPVPASDNVYVSFNAKNTNVEIKLYDVLGEEIYSESLLNFDGKYLKNINLAERAQGLYFLELKTNNSVVVRKFDKK